MVKLETRSLLITKGSSAFAPGVERRLEVEHRRAVERLEAGDAEPRPRGHLEDAATVQTDGIGPVLRPRAEDAGERRGGVVARVDRQHRAVATVEPGEHQDLAAGPQLPGRFRHRRIELEPGLRRALVALLRRLVARAQGRADDADGVKLE